MDPASITAALDLASREAWVPLTALLIGLVVRLLKLPLVPYPFDQIPPKYRSVVAVALGVLSSALDRIANGTPWRAALVSGLVAAALAVLTHDVVIEGLRGGREIGQSEGEQKP